jgi:uncharacterized protein with WD repeat
VTHVYSSDGQFLKEVCKGKFNLLRVSPDSRILCIAGFGSLKGDIDFYRLSDYTIIGRTNFYCCANITWSQDSKYLLGGVLSTKIKVDNEYRILSHNGEELVVEKFDGEIYDVQWVQDDTTNQHEDFKLEVSKVYLENLKKKKPEVKLTSTLGTINFTGGKMPSASSGEIPGLGKKKKKK